MLLIEGTVKARIFLKSNLLTPAINMGFPVFEHAVLMSLVYNSSNLLFLMYIQAVASLLRSKWHTKNQFVFQFHLKKPSKLAFAKI